MPVREVGHENLRLGRRWLHASLFWVPKGDRKVSLLMAPKHGDKRKRKRAEKERRILGPGGGVAKGLQCATCGMKNPVAGAPCPGSSAGMPHLIL